MAEPISPSSPSLISMRELDPSPVESPLSPLSPSSPTPEHPTSKASTTSPYFTNPSASHRSSSSTSKPNPTPKTTTSTLGLTLPTTLHLLQKYSTYPLTLFLGLHLTNTSLIPLLTANLHTSDTLLLLTRPYYQSPLFEPTLLLLPLATHLLSGLALRLHRRRVLISRHGAETAAQRRRIPWPKLSAQSLLGYALLPLVAGHSFVNRWLPLWREGGSSGVGLRYVAHGFAKHPLVANLGYGVLVGVGSWHFVGGAAKWAGWSREFVTEGGEDGRVKRRRRGWWVNALTVVVAGVWMAGGLGVVGRAGKGLGAVWEVRGWDEIYRRVPVFGGWL